MNYRIRVMINMFLLLLFLLGCQTEEIKQDRNSSCKEEFTLYSDSVSHYKIRMEDSIRLLGCQIIPIYASIIDSNRVDLLDKIEENSNVIKKMLEVDSEFTQLVFKNRAFQDFFLNQKISDKFLENFTYLIKKRARKIDRVKIKKDFNYMNYFLLSASYAVNKKEALLLYDKLKKNISVNIISSFGLVLNVIDDTYSFEELMDAFVKVSTELSSSEITNITYRPEYFAYFLPPTKESLDIANISLSKLEEIQESIQNRVIYIYKEMFTKYQYENGINQRDYALLTIENIYPYLLEQHNVSEEKFEKLFKLLINKDYMISLFSSGKCSQPTKEKFALFGEKNIQLAIKLMENKEKFFYRLSSTLSKVDNGIIPLFYVANLYDKLNREQWRIFENLLRKLPYDISIKLALIKKIEAVGYFDNIILYNDYTKRVESDYTPKSPNSPKYLNVLLTNYPRQTDVALADRILYEKNFNQRLLQKSLNDLISKDIDSLENHEFTKLERYLGNLDTIDNTLTVVAFIGAPFTGGVSLSYVALKTAGKMASKKGAKYLAKKILNKGIRKARVVRKGIDKKIGIKSRNLVGKGVENTADNVGYVSFAISMGTALFFMNNDIKIEKICEE